jgi:hypothetical protein
LYSTTTHFVNLIPFLVKPPPPPPPRRAMPLGCLMTYSPCLLQE